MKDFIKEINALIKNVEGSSLAGEIDDLLDGYAFLFSQALPNSFVKQVEKLYDILDECDGAGQERELKKLIFKGAK